MLSFTNEISEKKILLNPRPYAAQELRGRLLLLPLLPHKKPLKTLPVEIWSHVFLLLQGDIPGSLASMTTVCKYFTEIILPLMYCSVRPSSLTALNKLLDQLSRGESTWDSLRRIPYSTPGRWVLQLNLSNISPSSQTEAFELDAIVTAIIPLLPFLARLVLNPRFTMSRRAMSSLTQHVGIVNLKALEGIIHRAPDVELGYIYQEDPLIELLRNSISLEVLEVIGQGVDITEDEPLGNHASPPPIPSASFLPSFSKLKVLTLLSMPSSILLRLLLSSPLPNLRHLTISPYDDISYPTSLSSQLIATHGIHLRSLVLMTPKSWPTRHHSSPTTLLRSCPNVRHLSLEVPLPHLEPPSHNGYPIQHGHLNVITIPRPDQEFWIHLEALLPQLPVLRAVRIRDVKWLRKGLAVHAQHAGVQGQMKDWRIRLARWNIMMLDAEWKEDY